ncbi:MAG: DUF4440 domain-containing protein [Candidatus Eisenbacteria bacterium]|uniref:DUF4440 domain-containing protein n=1 Tax=Eiseniibacteriota bacterium TaxID=2212470 RepID=A0A538TJJ8_UNCEI|nr:MAG: DUF4440 domain-containing protein [Candidatus Eisenbacteria bacterium]
MRLLMLYLFAVPALLLGCSSAPMNLETERRAILARDQAWASAAAAKDLERTVAYWTDDATLMPPDMTALHGKVAIRQYVAGAFQAPGFGVTWKAQEVVVSPGGRMAYEIGTNQFTIADSAGVLHTSAGKAVAVWRKDPDGVWRCVVDIWNAAGGTH